jgi:glycolate oxidase FAD binding subunit
MIATATFRLHPLPEAGATAAFAGVPAAKVVELVAAARRAQLEPCASAAVRAGDGRFDVGVRFEGFAKGVAQQIARIVDVARAAGIPGEALADESAFWRRHDAARTYGSLRLKIAALPAQLPAVDALVAPILGALRGGTFVWYGTLGFGFVGGDAGDAAAAATALEAARAGSSIVIEAAPEELRACDPWGPVPGSFGIMTELKMRFDPERRLNPGRFVGGL